MSEQQGRPEEAAEQVLRRRTRRSFLTGAVAGLAALGGWRWLRTARPEDGVPWPLRRVLRFNEGLAERLYSPDRLAPTFPEESVRGPARINGLVGLGGESRAQGWHVRVSHEGRDGELALPL